jgi:N-acyl-D-amino-acid deacylase
MPAPAPAPAEPRPFLIRGARVIDGAGGEPFDASVRVSANGRISEIATTLTPGEGESVIDAGGRVLSPGFLDMHSHSDLYTMVRSEGADGPGVPLGDGPKLLQGCTTQVFGQDGISAAPVADHDVEGYAGYIAALDGFVEPARRTWRS